MNKRIKVLHLLQSSRFSGAENMVCQIIEILSDKDIEFAYCSSDGQIRQVLKERNITFFPLDKLNILEISKVIKKYNPDIIHSHDATASILAAIVGKKSKVISHMHGNHENMRTINKKSLLYLSCLQRFDNIIWVSNSALENYRFKKYVKDKSVVLYNIVNKDLITKDLESDQNVYDYDIVYLGRLTYPKNPERFLKIIKLVKEYIPSVRVAVVGTGDLLEETIELSKKLKLEGNIDFLGYKDNPFKILENSKAMVMTSRYEGTPMAALEAMALGVPIISTPTDGLKDIVKSGKNGYLSDNNNVLAQKIVEVINDRDLYQRLSNGAKEHFNNINNIEDYKHQILLSYFS